MGKLRVLTIEEKERLKALMREGWSLGYIQRQMRMGTKSFNRLIWDDPELRALSAPNRVNWQNVSPYREKGTALTPNKLLTDYLSF